MLVYGDRVRTAAPAHLLAQLAALGGGGCDRRAEALIVAGQLAQGLADAEMEASGADDATPLQAAALALATAEAAALLAADGQPAGPADTAARARLAALPLPARIRCRTPEGFAFYALAPQAVAAAAARVPWDDPPLVIGIRSIGTALAAVVAARLGAEGVATEAMTVRPVGHPLQRSLRLAPRLAARLRAHPGSFLVVDEGPGLSGSSFGSVAAALAALGVAPGRIVFLPSHGGDPGACATPAVRTLWSRAARLVPEPVRPEAVAHRFADLTGPAAAEDLSAGAWRRDGPTLPATPAVERMKVRLAGPAGRFVARFAGLGAAGTAKLALARRLHAAGFAPEPLALRHGFLLERWVEGAPLGAGERPSLDHLARYLGFRARTFPANREDGAPTAALAEMAAFNAGALGGPELRERVADALAGGDWAAGLVPVRIDGRLHPWEWRRAPDGRLVKTDAVDHAAGHDLVGCQDIAWDVAGAAVEFGLAAAETERLREGVARAAGRAVSPAAVPAFRLCYAAFQGGLWRMLGEPGNATDTAVARYTKALAARLPEPVQP